MSILQDLKSELRKALEEGINDAIKALKKYLPEQNEKYKLAVLFQSNLNAVNKNRLRGLISNEDLRIEYNKIRMNILELIDSLTEEDFKTEQPDSASTPTQLAKRGKVLHKIPKSMPLNKETKCVVRIAFDEEAIIRDIEIDEHISLQDIRVSDIMQVEVLDPSDTTFVIRNINSPEQFVEEGEYTEWLFYIKPLKQGTFPLLLKIAVIELIKGKERKREIVLEETIKIIAEAPVEESTIPFTKAGVSLSLSPQPVESTRGVKPGQERKNLPQQPHVKSEDRPSAGNANLVMRWTLYILGFLIVFTGITWGIAPQEVNWLTAHYISHNQKGYKNYLDKYPDSRHTEEAFFLFAALGEAPKPYRQYLKKYPNGKFEDEAKKKIEDWEVNTWEKAKAGDEVALKKYLRWFPKIFLEKPVDKKTPLEEKVWNLVEQDSIKPVRYIENYPAGKFINLARKKLKSGEESNNQ